MWSPISAWRASLIAVIVVAEGARRDEAVGAGLVELHEQAGARDAADAALEDRADAVGEEMRDQPVDRLALGLHGAPLGGRDARRDFVQRRHVMAFGSPSEPNESRGSARDARSGRHSGGSAR